VKTPLTHFLALRPETEMFMNEKNNVVLELSAKKWLHYGITATTEIFNNLSYNIITALCIKTNN
jgi:hypothetical protein